MLRGFGQVTIGHGQEEKRYRTKGNRPVSEVLSPRKAVEVGAWTMAVWKLHEMAELIWLHEDFEEGEHNARIVRAMELYEDLKPMGSTEGS